MEKHNVNKMCIRNNPGSKEMIQSEKRVPITLLPANTSDAIGRLKSNPKFESLVLRTQFAADTNTLKHVKPMMSLYTNYPKEVKLLFSDSALERVKRIIQEYPLLERNVHAARDRDCEQVPEGGRSGWRRRRILPQIYYAGGSS